MPETRKASVQSPYWRKNLLLIVSLLAIWLLVTLFPLGFASMPEHWTVAGWPLAFGLGAFVVPLIYLLLIGIYCVLMNRRDRQASESKDAQADATP
jgi:putative solute:sodium symporter small subunit